MALEKLDDPISEITKEELRLIREGKRELTKLALAKLAISYLELIKGYNEMVDIVEKLRAKDNIQTGVDDLLSRIKTGDK